MGGITSYFGQWAKQPWSEDVDVWGWVLFILFFLTVAYGWSQIMRYIIEDL